MTICLICDKGERAGGHDWKTGIAPKSDEFPEHKFEPDLRPDSQREHRGFHDRFVANRHKQEKQ